MTRNQQVATIRDAFNTLPEMQDGYHDVRERLFAMNIEQERRHRHGYLGRQPMSINDAAKLFVVKHLLEGWQEPNRFSVDDILSIRNEVLYAQAYAKKFHDVLAPWAAGYAQALAQVDYAELMKAA